MDGPISWKCPGSYGRTLLIYTALLLVPVFLFCPAAYAGKADVQFVHLTEKSPGRWNISVTCRHDDKDMSHYCDWWRARAGDGVLDAKRVMKHAHGSKPFTRSLENVEIHHGVLEFLVEANCSVHGLGGKTVRVDFGKMEGPGYKIVRLDKKKGVPDKKEIARMIEQMAGGSMSQRVKASNIQRKLAGIGKPAVPQLLNGAANHKDPWVRIWCMGALGRMREPKAVDVMMANTRHGNATVRHVATGQLVRYVARDKRIELVLAERMADEYSDVREWASKGLMRIRNPGRSMLDTLERNTGNDDVEIGIVNMALLAGLTNRMDPLVYILRATKSENPKIRSAAYGALTKIPPLKKQVKEYVELLLKALDDPSDRVKREGVRGLMWVIKEGADTLPRKLSDLIGFTVEGRCPKMLDSANEYLRGDALMILALRRRRKVLTPILKATSDESPYVREKALRALANTATHTRTVGDAIFKALNDEEAPVASTALNAVAWFVGKGKAKKIMSPDGKKHSRKDMTKTLIKWWETNRKLYPK